MEDVYIKYFLVPVKLYNLHDITYILELLSQGKCCLKDQMGNTDLLYKVPKLRLKFILVVIDTWHTV